MPRTTRRMLVVFAALLLGDTTMVVLADEGMWLPNNPPRELLRRKYNMELSDAWLENVRLSSVRFNSGASGAVVSPDGLVVTNHHVGADSIQKLSSKERDYYHDGFYAQTQAAELKCPDMELNILQSIQDVTERVNAAVKPGAPAAEAAAARRAVMAEIEGESLKSTGLRSDVVTLYQGGMYHLYRYKKYTDVRLVFAPENAIASFGGDVDNFEYPRYNLDVSFFRLYEDGKPARMPHFLPWSQQGPKEGDLVFVSGHPGTTNRQETVARLKHRRDVTLPYTLSRLRAQEALLIQFAARGREQSRQAQDDLRRVANSRKAFAGQYQGLLADKVMSRKIADEAAFREQVGKSPNRQEKYGKAWDRIARAQDELNGFERNYSLIELGDAFDTKLFRIARHLVRLAAESSKPSGARLREYRESALESLRLQLFSPAPIYPDLEREKLAGSLTFLAERLGGESPLVQKILVGKSPSDRAADLIAGTRLIDQAERRKLAASAAALAASDDSMIRLAILVDGEARELRRKYDELEEGERQAYGQIAAARFELFGANIAPDATFTLRVAFGVVGGYRVDGKDLPFHTTFREAFARAEEQSNQPPFDLPGRWLSKKSNLSLDTPFNFVSTADTIGGNSGSPVLSRSGEVVGINFDRNRHGLVRNFVYTDEQARHIAVHSRAVIEALGRVYDAQPLLQELLGK